MRLEAHRTLHVVVFQAAGAIGQCADRGFGVGVDGADFGADTGACWNDHIGNRAEEPLAVHVAEIVSAGLDAAGDGAGAGADGVVVQCCVLLL